MDASDEFEIELTVSNSDLPAVHEAPSHTKVYNGHTVKVVRDPQYLSTPSESPQGSRHSSSSRQMVDLDFENGKRRSRHFAVSDTSDLTSPQEVKILNAETLSTDIPVDNMSNKYISSLERLSHHSINNSYNNYRERSESKQDTDSVHTNISRTSELSNHSYLRQSESYSLSLSPSNNNNNSVQLEPDSNTITIYPASTSPNLNNSNQEETQKQVYKKSLAPQLSRTRSQIDKKLSNIRIPRDSSFRRLARQISGHRDSVDLESDTGNSYTGKRPKSYFDVAIMTMCCCVSPLGFVAVILSVLSESNFKAQHIEKSRKYGRFSLILSILGMVTTVAIAITLLVVLSAPKNTLSEIT